MVADVPAHLWKMNENYPRAFLQVEKFGRLGTGIEKLQSLDENVAKGLSCCDRMDEIPFFTC